MELAYFWPNGDWCWADELEEYSHNMSDDVLSYRVADEDEAERVALEVHKHGVRQ